MFTNVMLSQRILITTCLKLLLFSWANKLFNDDTRFKVRDSFVLKERNLIPRQFKADHFLEERYLNK